MQISGEYGTELLIRYTDERLTRDLERRRIADERRAETEPRERRAGSAIGARLAAVFRGTRMPSGSARRAGGPPRVHAAQR